MNEPVGGRLLVLGASVLLLGLLGCRTSTDGEPSAPIDTPTPTPAAAVTAGPSAELTIVVDPGNGGTTTTWRLSCGPAGGNHPDPVGACQALEVNGATALPPVPKDRACTMIYGGPERATVTGTLDGKKVSSTFSRTNGCEMDRWSQLVPLLPEPTS